MNWKILSDSTELEAVLQRSFEKPQVIFKHSTKCSVSSMAKSRLERAAEPDGIDFNYLDLIAHRNLSNKIAEDLKVWHESPQVLVLKNGACIYDESHTGISMEDILEAV